MKKIIAGALLSAAMATPALAQRESHWYGALDAGTLTMQNTAYASPGSVTISGGYRMSRNLALEGGVTAIADSSLYGTGTSTTARQGDLRFLAIGILPVGQNIELFGKAGIGFHTARITNNLDGSYDQHTTGNAILGFGGQFNFNAKFGLRLQYEHLGKSKSTDRDPGADISRVSMGGVLNF